MKICSICKEEKELTEYYKQNKYSKAKGNWIYYNPECKTCTKKRSVEWYKENPDNFKENRKKYSAKPKTKEMVKENNIIWRNNGNLLNWQRKNKDKLKKYAISRQNKLHEFTKIEWYYCKEYFNFECAYCGIPEAEAKIKYKNNLHKEHVIHDGSNKLDNCVPACKVCNSSKTIKSLEEWYNSNNPIYSKLRLNKIHQWLNVDVYKIGGIRNDNKK